MEKYSVHGWEELILSKRPWYSKLSTESCNSYQDSNGIFHRSRKNYPRIRMERTTKDSRAKAMSNKNKTRESTLPDF